MANHIDSYKKYQQVQINTASRMKLVLMLYNAAIGAMKKAIHSLEQEDVEGKGKCLIKAQDIILELMVSLDLEVGEMATNLQRLYLYCYRRLIEANINMDPKPIEEVIGLMSKLQDAWEKIVAEEDVGKDPKQSSEIAMFG